MASYSFIGLTDLHLKGLADLFLFSISGLSMTGAEVIHLVNMTGKKVLGC